MAEEQKDAPAAPEGAAEAPAAPGRYSAMGSGVRQDHLAVQDLATLDVTTLTPSTPEVISRQATINIGTIGHVAHGKSTVVRSVSGVQTVRFKNELVRNITIKLGYANAKLYKARDAAPGVPGNYRSKGSAHPDVFEEDGKTWELQRHVSFVDCPGHDILMATMLNGAAVMDAALLLIAGNEPCPQPQTSEHLAAVEIMRLQHIIILQNKVDLVKEEDALAQHQQIRRFVAGTVADSAPVIPMSAVLKYNVDVLCEYLVHRVPEPRRDFLSVPRLIVIRSFDVNKPGMEAAELRGGVAGGSILQGVLRVGDRIEIRPGILSKNNDGSMRAEPIYSVVKSLYAEQNDLQYAVPGGLIGVGTLIDPTLTRADRLVGQVLGLRDQLPSIFTEVEISFYLLKRLLGVKTSEGSKQTKVGKLKKDETLMVNIGSTATGGARRRGEEGEGQDPAHAAGVHAGGREDRAQPARRQALAPHRLGADPQGNTHRGPELRLAGPRRRRGGVSKLLGLGLGVVGESRG